MTQLPHDEFETSLEKAETWMKEIHKQLKENDNTQGPRSALESRLRETERICSLEGDGKLLVEKVLMKAEVLLGDSSEEEKLEVQLKLAKIKGLFEETTTYMIHCHSRIEWVWLHWNEYLRARDEFTLWVHNVSLTLEPDVELQLGLKEKRWQYEQALVLLRDVLHQSRLVERLLEEASSLYNRIGDPSVEESVQSAMMAEYLQIKKKAQERVERLDKIWKDHEAYEGDVSNFKTWLNSVIEKLKVYVGAASACSESRLDILQEISKDVESGNKQLEVLEEKSAEVIRNTSPLGADKICRELEELRKTLKELKQMNDEEEETLLKTHNSDNAFLLLARQLEANINEFRKATQRLEESLESGERVKSEDELIALWKTLNATKSALAAEEAKAERVKVQLKDLFKFSKDVQPLSDGVISAMRDYQRAKSKAFKLSTDTESELRQLFQTPLREFLYWKPIAESVLDATAFPVNDGAMNRDALDNIEKLLGESCTIKNKLVALEKKKAHIHLVLGDQKTMTLLQDIAAAEQDREALHRDLLERKKSLQSLAELRKEFDSALKTLHHKISTIRVKSLKENEPQPDIIGKEAQVQRLQILLEDLRSLHTPIQELISLTKSHSPHALRAEQLNSDYLKLQRSLENKIRNSNENIHNHRLFSHHLRDLQHWITVTCQDLESYQNGGKNWGERDIEALNVEFSEKEIQRHLVEVQGQAVMDSSSPEGAALIQQEIKQLIASWKSLQLLYEQMSSLISDMDTDEVWPKDETPTSKKTTKSFIQDGPVIHIKSSYDVSTSGSPKEEGVPQIWGSSGISRDGQVIHKGSLHDVSTSGSPGKEGFRQIGGSSSTSISQVGQVIHMDSTDDIHTSGSSEKEGILQIRGPSSQDGQTNHKDSLDDIDNNISTRKEGFPQVGGSSGIRQDGQVQRINPLDDISTGGFLIKEGFQQIDDSSGIIQDGQVFYMDSRDDIQASGSSRKEGIQQIGQDGQIIHKDSLDNISKDSSGRKKGLRQIRGSSSINQDGQVIHVHSVNDITNSGSPRMEGFRQIGGSFGIGQDRQVIHKNSLDDISTDGSPRNISQDGQIIHKDSLGDIRTSGSPRKEGFQQIGDSSGRDRQVVYKNALDDISTDCSPRKEEFRQIGGSFSFGQDGQVIHMNSLYDISTDGSARKEGFRQIGDSSSEDRQGRYMNFLDDVSTSGSQRKEGFQRFGGLSGQDGQVINMNLLGDISTRGSPTKEGFRQIGGLSSRDRQGIHKDSLDDISASGSSRQEGFLQIGGSSGISQDQRGLYMNSLDDVGTSSTQKKEGFRQFGGSSGNSQDQQGLYMNSLDDVSTSSTPRTEGFRQIDDSSGSSYNVVTNSNTELPDGRPRYNKPPGVLGQKEKVHSIISANEKSDGDHPPEIQDNNSSYRVSGNGSNSPRRSNNQRDKSLSVKRASGVSSIDRSSYEFRVIEQEDEKSGAPGSTNTDGQSFRNVRKADGSTKMSSNRGLGWNEYRGSGNEEVNGLGGPRGHRLNGDSCRVSSPTQSTSPSHTPVTSKWSPAAAGDLTFRTGRLQDEERQRRPGPHISSGHPEITSGFIAEVNMKKREKSPNNLGTSRRNQKFVSLAESVDLVDSPSNEGTGSEAGDDHMKLLLEFELWLQAESAKLNQICAAPVSGLDGVKTRKSQLQNLQFRVPQGQSLFESLLRSRSSMTVTEELKLEELRYLWMLHKSKLRDSGKHMNMKVAKEPRGITKAPGGLCSFLHRVCCAALPLQLLLLLLLLLAFLLPLLQETKNCALSNNYARSFNLMLKYEGPPPT